MTDPAPENPALQYSVFGGALCPACGNDLSLDTPGLGRCGTCHLKNPTDPDALAWRGFPSVVV